MRRFLLLALMGMGMVLPMPVNADLGAADQKSISNVSFDIYCGNKKNKCKVTFEGNRFKVDGGKGISGDQILVFDAENVGIFQTVWEYTLTYLKEDGTQGNGIFYIKHTEMGTNKGRETKKLVRQFDNQLKALTGMGFGERKSLDVNVK